MIEPVYITKSVPTSGMNSKYESVSYEGSYSPYMKNATVDGSVLRKRNGYSLLGFGGTEVPLKGVGMSLIDYYDANGLLHLIAITTTNAYEYDSDNNRWNDITPLTASATPDGVYDILCSTFDGVDEATAYTDPVDDVAAGFVGTAQLDTSQKKFGTASLLLDGNSDYITYGTCAGFDLEAGDGTIACYIRFASISGNQCIFSLNDATHTFNLLYLASGYLYFECKAGTPIQFPIALVTSNFTPVASVWYHIAIVKKDDTIYVYIDGVLRNSGTIVGGGSDIDMAAVSLSIGANVIGAAKSMYFNGWIDQFRWSKGIATWTADFNPNSYFTGDSDNRFSSVAATDMAAFVNNNGTALMLTNNVDNIHYFEGASAELLKVFYSDYGDITPEDTLPNAAEITEFYYTFMRLCMSSPNGNVRSLHHSAAGDIADTSGAGSDSYVLTDSKGKILRALKLAGYLIIYSEKSITIGRYYGSVSLFTFPTLIYETGLFAPNAIVATYNAHYFLGTDQKVYAYYGETQLVNIGDVVDNFIFDTLDIANKNKIASGSDYSKGKIYFAIPSVGDSYAKDMIVVNRLQNGASWEYFRFNDCIRSISTFENTFAWYCDGTSFAAIHCDESPLYCDDGYGQLAYPIMCFLSDDGYVYTMSSLDGLDNGQLFEFEVQTPDMTISNEENFARWQWFSFTAKSNLPDSTCYVYYSTDDGDSWTNTASLYDVGLTWSTIRVPIDVVARKIRFKIYQYSDRNIQLRGLFKCKAIPQPERD
jgi:hypothetical protein